MYVCEVGVLTDGWQGDSEQMEALMDCSNIKCEGGAGPLVRMQET